MSLLSLPYRRENGARNMAADWWMLSRAPDFGGPLFRRYGWIQPQITFGYGQKAHWVETETGVSLERMTRRPTGGGIVRHGTDFTYALALPRGSAGSEMPPMQLYGRIHQRLGEAILEQGVETSLMPCPNGARAAIPGDCFLEPVGRDLMDQSGTVKLAGAAMKRTREGVLVQGALELRQWPSVDHERVEKRFLQLLEHELKESVGETNWPEDFEEQTREWAGTFASRQWNWERKRSAD